MKHTVPTLTALAAFAVIGAPAFGASFADDLVIKPAAQLQLRAQLGATGTGTNGDDYNIYSGAAGQNDPARFSLRRARFGVSAKNSTGWDALFQVRAGERSDAGTGATSNQPVTLYYANVGKVIKTDSIEHRIHGGLDKPFNGESSISSSTYMFPNDRAVANLIEYRGPGIGYTLKHELLKFGFDIADGGDWSNFSAAGSATGTAAGNTGVGIAAPAAQGTQTSTETKPGLFYSARIEFAPGAEYMPTKKMESFAGAEGTHVVIGLDLQSDSGNQVNNAAGGGVARSIKQTTTIIGPDVLVHMNGLSGLAEYRAVMVKQDVTGGTPATSTGADDVKGSAFDILVGYAIPTDTGLVVEPAIKYGKVDINKDQDEGAISKYTNGEWQSGKVSGSEITLGLNLYWNGNANKTQFAYSMFKGEAPVTGDEQKANVFTIQQQVTF